MLGREDGFDAIAVLDSFHLVLVIFSPSSEVRGSEDDYDSLMCGLLGYIFAFPCGPRFKAMFTLCGSTFAFITANFMIRWSFRKNK
jgi:hypothetical protein